MYIKFDIIYIYIYIHSPPPPHFSIEIYFSIMLDFFIVFIKDFINIGGMCPTSIFQYSLFLNFIFKFRKHFFLKLLFLSFSIFFIFIKMFLSIPQMFFSKISFKYIFKFSFHTPCRISIYIQSYYLYIHIYYMQFLNYIFFQFISQKSQLK